jgi:hypothetical protein
MNPFNHYPSDKISEIIFNDSKLALVHYPIWKAFAADIESDLWIEVIPKIDVNSGKIIFNSNTDNSSDEDNKAEDKDNSFTESNSINSDKFFNSIPNEIKSYISAFSDSHWQLIKAVLLIGDDFILLLKSTPSFAYLIANVEKFNPSFIFFSNIHNLQRMIRTKRMDILGLCGFPKTDQMVKIFSKLKSSEMNLSLFEGLREILVKHKKYKSRIMEVFSHSKKIDEKLIKFCFGYPELTEVLGNKIIFQLVEDEDFSEKAKKLKYVLVKSNKYKIPFPKISSASNIETIVDRFEERLKEKVRELDLFPPQPLDDSPYIKAITSETQLKAWARRQQNCIRGYIKKIREGKVYFYQVVFNNEEATLEIKIKNGTIKKGDLLGFRNQKVSNELSAIVDRWLIKSIYKV